MRGEQFLHSLTRITKEGDNIPLESQNIGSFAGFQALWCNEVNKSKLYCWLTFPKPAPKLVTYEIMTRILKVIDEKNMSFVLLTGDQPVYTLIVQIRNENDEIKIIPILGPFHTQVAFITAIWKTFEGSGLSDIFVSAGIIADKSVYQAMRGRHFRRIARAPQLTYESVQCRIIGKSINKGVNLPEYLHEKITSIRAKSTDIDKQYLWQYNTRH